MSARIAELLRAQEREKHPVKPVPAAPAYRRALIAKPIGQPGDGITIDEVDFAAIEVIETVKHAAGYLVHRAYCNDGQTIEIIEIPAEQARAVWEGLE